MQMAPQFNGRPFGRDWLDQVFRAKTAAQGGVLRRRIADVEREVGRAEFELEVRRRGFRLIECGGHFVVICTRDPIRIIC